MKLRKLDSLSWASLLVILIINSQPGTSTTIEVESAVIKCTERNDDEKVINWKPKPLTSFQEEIKPGPHEPDSDLKLDLENDIDLKLETITGCKKKMVVTLKITNQGTDSEDGSLIKVDHVKDEETGHSSRVAHPIAIKLQQGPMFKAYKLHYVTAVNAEPHEEVINYENTKDFKGCNDGDKSPTCGFERNEQTGEIIYSSRGFCCDCDKAEQDSNSKQIRGSQTCVPNSTEPYYASAHCLKYNDYWYGMYDLGKTDYFHLVDIEAYQSIEFENGTVSWEQIGGKDTEAKIDSLQTKEYKKGEDIAVIYRKFESRSLKKGNFDPTKNVLLMPKPFLIEDAEGGANIPPLTSYPEEFRGDIEDTHLIVPKTLVDPSGTQCDKVGVDHVGFRGQGKPCVQKQGSCLKNQPFQLWRGESADSASSASKSHYRLKNYGSTHKVSPFKMILGNLYLIMEHDDEVSAYIDIEVNADNLEMAKPGYNVAILSVSGESSSTAGKMFVQVTNNEAIGSFYSVHLLQCTEGIPLHKSDRKMIDALSTEEFQLDIKHYPHSLSSIAKCSVGVINMNNEVVAIRKAQLSPLDICFCSFLCSCVCTKDSFECMELSPAEARAAGLDIEEEEPVEHQYVELAENNLEYFIPLLILILLILGICKGMIGRWCFKKIGIWGLGVFHERPRKLKQYFETEYSRAEVVYDDEGNPVDPFTKKQTVQRLSSTEEFGLNSVFFLCCPLLFLWTLIRCCCNCIKGNKSESKISSKHGSKQRDLEQEESEFNFQTRTTSQMGSSKKSALRSTSSMPNQPSTFSRTHSGTSQIRSMPVVGSNYKSNQSPAKSPVTSRPISASSKTYGSWHRRPEDASGSEEMMNAGKTNSTISRPSQLSVRNSQHSNYESNEVEE